MGSYVITAFVLGFMLSTAWAGARPQKSTTAPDAAVREADRSELVSSLSRAILTQQFKQITMVTPEQGEQRLHPPDSRSPASIDWLPLPVLLAASYILDPKLRGEQLDLLVQTENAGYTPVVAIHEVDGSVRIEMGEARHSLLADSKQPMAAEEMVRRFGIRAVRGGGGPWKRRELRSLELALTLLTPEEQALIRDVLFVWQVEESKVRASRRGRTVWGRYRAHRGGQKEREIQLFDAGASSGRSVSVDDPDRPNPLATLCLLHEIGRAIADSSPSRLPRRQGDLLVATKGQISDRMALPVFRSLSQTPGREGGQSGSLFAESGGDRAVGPARKRELGGGATSPVLTAYADVLWLTSPPRRSGRTRISELFAETFALYKADPSALLRTRPELYAWFGRGGHIKPLIDASSGGASPLRSPSVPSGAIPLAQR